MLIGSPLIWFLMIIMVSIKQGYASYEYYYHNSVSKDYVKIFKTPDFSRIQIFQCKYEVDRIIFHCNPYSNKLIDMEVASYINEMSRDDCLNVHNNQTLLTSTGLMVNIGLNGTTKFKQIVAGHKTIDECQGAIFFDGTNHWTNVVVEYIFTLRITDFSALFSLSNDIININGTNYNYSKLECTDKYTIQNFWIDEEISYFQRIWNFVLTVEPLSPHMQFILMFKFLKWLFYFVSLFIVTFSIAVGTRCLGGVGKIIVSS